MKAQSQKPFKQANPLDKRIQMFEQSKKKQRINSYLRNPNCIVAIVQKDPKCVALPDLKHKRFSIPENQKIMQVCNAIRTRILAMDDKYKNQPFFFFTNRELPNKEKTIKQIYQTQKDPEDGLLYFKFSNVDPF